MEDHSAKKGKTSQYDDDQISQLPCNVLNAIFSSLTMREAVRTSVLSTKWRYLWTKSLSNLTFDVPNILDREEYTSIDILYTSEIHKLIIPWKRKLAFLNSVDQLLADLSPDHKIEKLKVHFTFHRNKYGTHLDRWICFAILRGVEELDLSLLEIDYYFFVPLKGSIYDFPCDLLREDGSIGKIKSFLKCLRLAHCNLAPRHTNLIGFNTLTTLDLKWVDLTSNECVCNLLSSCRALEWLSLDKCYGLDYLCIAHPSCVRLKYLNVHDCKGLSVIEISGINLEKFEYKGYKISFVLNEAVIVPKEFPTFSNLKLLSIAEIPTNECDLLWIATLLKATASLQRLELHIHSNDNMEEPREIKRLPRCLHDYLKEVVITGTCGHFSEIEFAIYILNNAVVLDKMMIDPHPRYYTGNGKWDVLHACDSWKIIGRKRVLEHLTREASSQMVLMIL
ncbi:F-box/FBD/LRR-repeat protein [Camellia lanceoleosa]|uniref:F-box/FBD/LRR-repeat protein n=1 Tax=Camellia lanceoleosa TaxID=1840588 RepID=A0ACC0G5L6_9ERIC|nr:F-box/FBD/LRR-repeat protein [Camellia lanceoleosa]